MLNATPYFLSRAFRMASRSVLSNRSARLQAIPDSSRIAPIKPVPP
jgi:hypothetical protein